MKFIEDYGKFLLWLAIGLIVLMVVLNFAKKAPVVGPFAQDAQNLIQSGSITG